MYGAVVSNALLMTITFQLFHFTRKKLGTTLGYISLIVYWVSFEYFHMNWDLTWPWLTLGNGFASYANMVQWYEYTGVFGGSIWILISNIIVLQLIYTSNKIKGFTQLAILISIPLLISFGIYKTYTETNDPIEAVAVQPNIDPYNEKFGGISSDLQLAKILRLAEPLITAKTSLVVCPETALSESIWKDQLTNHPQINTIRKFIAPFPNLQYLTGLTLCEIYRKPAEHSATARKFPDGEDYYDVYNAAMQINRQDSMQLHYKSKLVPGVEKMPFPKLFGYLENFAIDLGGASGSLGSQEHPSVFSSQRIIAAPVICYESVYGEYLSEYIRKGANVICIMTNDGWWKDTPGHRQHCQYARLRAIEERRSIVRSANTGTSCFINQLGEISQATEWWFPTAIKANINLNNKITFYGMHGDYLAKISMGIAILVLAYSIFKRKQ